MQADLEMEWRRDELLIEADGWEEIMRTEAQRQQVEIRRSLDHMVRLKEQVDLTPLEKWSVDQTLKMLRAHLLRLRAAEETTRRGAACPI